MGCELQYALGRVRDVRIRDDLTIRCHPGAYRFAYHDQNDDPDQIAEFDEFLAHCRTGIVLFDIGAHFGLFSLAALVRGGATARALAVDPSPVATRMLAIQGALNDCGERLTVVRACVGARVGVTSLVDAGVNSVGYFVQPGPDHTPGETTAVPSVTIDSLAEEHHLVPTHVKIDVEGFELDVLQGARTVLGTAAPQIFLELHNDMIRSRGGRPEEVLDVLSREGYRAVTGGRPLSRDEILKRPITRFVGLKGDA
jgi:FkbM family methyltransferase